MSSVSSHGHKRRRIDANPTHNSGTFTSGVEIDEALRAHSSLSPEVKASVNKFKDFLTSINKYDKSQHLQQEKKLLILKDYCNLQTAASQDDLDFRDLLSTWSKAVETGNDPVASAVPAALAQFFRTISGVLEFRDFGLSLCHSLLKRNQVRLFDRGLFSQRSKEHLISPCLRLLTEITSFDGGTLANNVFSHKDVLFKRLDFLLDTRPAEAVNDRRKPTVRRMVLRLLIANFLFLDDKAKVEFLTQQRIFRAMGKGFKEDGDDILFDILKAIETGVLDDVNLSRGSKLGLFVPEFLSALSALYIYEADATHPDSASTIREAVHKLLLKICTTRKGIVISQSGWYPVGYNVGSQADQSNDYIDLGLDSPLYFDDYSHKLPVKNTTLSEFCHTLKPSNDVLQAELLTKTLGQVTELIAEYFTKPSKLTVAVGDDSQWRGHFAFLFSVVQTKVPRNLGWPDAKIPFPPPISVVIESILPRPLDTRTLSRFFTLDDEILNLSGCRLVSVALDKLSQVLTIFRSYQEADNLWTQAYDRLVEAVLQKVPKYKDLVDAYQRCSKDNSVLRTALFECMAMYHKLLPETTMGSSFDVGPILLGVLQEIATESRSDGDLSAVLEQISWLVTIAQLSPATKWFSKSSADDLSLFTTILRFVLSNNEPKDLLEIARALRAVLMSTGILQQSSESFSILQLSLSSIDGFDPTFELFVFIDNSLNRSIQKPVKYLDQLEHEQSLVSDKTPLSILACAVSEQWEFALKKHEGQPSTMKVISEWVARLFSALESLGENFRVLNQFQDNMLASGDDEIRVYFQSAIDGRRKYPVDQAAQIKLCEQVMLGNIGPKNSSNDSVNDGGIKLNDVLGQVTPPPDSLERIDRWDAKTDVELAIQTGKVAKLIRCASSEESEIRVQAYQFLQTLVHLVDQSNYSEKGQVYLLIGEICETIRQQGFSRPLPSMATELGARLLHVLTDPANKLFTKANEFLLLSPAWDMSRLVPTWTKTIIFTEPDSDEPTARTEIIEWYLSCLADGLKTPDDMEMYRRSGVFEKLLNLYSSPATLRSTQKLILTVLWRAISVGGANTLITRVGLHKWLEIVGNRDKEHSATVRALLDGLMDASDPSTIKAWEKSCPLTRSIQRD